MKTLTLLTISLAVAVATPPGKDVPGPMVEDGPPAGVPEEDVAPAPEEQQENQPRGGHNCPGFTHDDRCYQFFRGPKRANDAEVFCQKVSPGGHLASITSRHQHREVMRQLLRVNGDAHVWVGGLRYRTTGRFTWLDGSSWVYSDWMPGKPRPTSNTDNCVELMANGKFNDVRCSEAKAFVCSYPERY